jgi:hypothetical protein
MSSRSVTGVGAREDSAHLQHNDLNEIFELWHLYMTGKGRNVANAMLAKTCGLMVSYYDYTMI